MSTFTAPLLVEILVKTRKGRVVARTLKTFEFYHDGGLVTVPTGYETDFASVPRVFWIIAPPLGPYAKAAVVHDFLCDSPGGFSRRRVDAIFLEAMLVLGVFKPLAWSMWFAVRAASILRGKK